MLIEEIKSIKSDKKELRKFGITVGVVLVLIGFAFQLIWDNYTIYMVLGIIGAFLIFFGILIPAALLPVQKAWMILAVVLGFIMTRVILSILFYLIVTPIGFVAKIVGKDFLNKKIDKTKKTYWHKRENKKYQRIYTERQF